MGTSIVQLRNLNFINLKDYGCLIDGVHDDSVGFSAAYAAAATQGMGIFHPGGTLIKGNDTIQPLVPVIGSGKGQSIIKLKNSANTDLFSGQTNLIDLFAPANSGPQGTLYGFSFRNLTLDGNKANQSPPASTFTDAFQYDSSAKYIKNTTIGSGTLGTWTIDTTNHYVWTSTGNENMFFYNGKMTNGATTAILQQCDNAGLVARVVDHNNLYVVYIYDASASHGTPNTAIITRIQSGSYNNLFGGAFSIPTFTRATQHTFVLSVVGSTITFSMDGSTLKSGTDSNIASAGNWGLDGGNGSIICNSLTVPVPGTSYPLRFYGYNYLLENLAVANGYSGNILSDWNSGNNFATDSMEAHIINVKTHDSGGVGIDIGGPHDSMFVNIDPFLEGSHCLHLAPNALGAQFVNFHGWEPASGCVTVLNEASQVMFDSSEAESSNTVQVVTVAQMNWDGGFIFSGIGGACTGLKLGQHAGETPYAGQVMVANGLTTDQFVSRSTIRTTIANCTGTNGALWLDADGGGNEYEIIFDQTSGTPINGTMGWSSKLSALTPQLTSHGTLALGQSDAAQAIATAGTITLNGYIIERLAPTGNVTGVIMPVGTQAGQYVILVNESAFSITMAAAGTSHVSGGTGVVIAAGGKLILVWDSSVSLWF